MTREESRDDPFSGLNRLRKFVGTYAIESGAVEGDFAGDTLRIHQYDHRVVVLNDKLLCLIDEAGVPAFYSLVPAIVGSWSISDGEHNLIWHFGWNFVQCLPGPGNLDTNVELNFAHFELNGDVIRFKKDDLISAPGFLTKDEMNVRFEMDGYDILRLYFDDEPTVLVRQK